MSVNTKIISLADVTHSDRSRDGLFSALLGVTFDLSAGQSCAIVGESGSGKSTLLNILGLLDIPSSGSYQLNGEEVSKLDEYRRAVIRNRYIGFIFPSSTVGAAGSYDVVVDISSLSNEEQKVVRIGMSARIDITTYSAAQGIVVPPSSIQHNDKGESYVEYKRTLQESSAKLPIKIGHTLPQGVEILNLQEGYIRTPKS